LPVESCQTTLQSVSRVLEEEREEGERIGVGAYPDTASLSTVEFRLASMKVCPTSAPFCGLLPFATNSWALMLLLFVFATSISITTSDGRLNCESIMPRVRISKSNETSNLLAFDVGGSYVQSVQVRWPDKTESMVLNL